MMEIPDVNDGARRGAGSISDADRTTPGSGPGRDHEAARCPETGINTLPTITTLIFGEPAGLVNEAVEILW
jgi:hypothetical protein